ELFPEVEKLRGDRAVDPIPSGAWDGVIDTSGLLPGVVRASAEALRDSKRYLFVSTISVYADLSQGPTEDAPRAQLGDMPSDEMLPGYENYGALKALCEDVVTEVYAERALIVRPGLIVGPHDPTGRFTCWPHRIARGGQFVVPGPPEEQVQFVDVRDLGAWLVDLLERGDSGAFNATHPGTTWGELVESCVRVTGSNGRPVWIDPEWLADQGVGEWMELPLWLHDPDSLGMMRADVSRAVAAGLTFRPLDETVRGTLELAEPTEDAGLTPERERALLEAWRP
ncbi:MAG TPA: NAD-dependent epimerase/dehydratase family protein, partial [Gaiellaceae bacterium]|nr:NAD-dependent epimerase/dehydratase family protein [Gaiellaceae bacterium]